METSYNSWDKQAELSQAMAAAIEAYMREVFRYQRDIRGLGMFGGTAHYTETREIAQRHCESAVEGVMTKLQLESL